MKEKIVACLKKSLIAYWFQNVYLRYKISLGKIMLCFAHNSRGNRRNDVDEKVATELLKSIKGDTCVEKGCACNRYREDVMVSIIVPIYNASQYLEKCLESLKNQKTKYVYEIICVDDGSTDESGTILSRYRENTLFKVITQENAGHSGARNAGLAFPLGKYVMFVDADDYVADNYVEQLVDCVIKEEADVVVCSYLKCNAKDKVLKKYYYPKKKYDNFFDYVVFDGVAWGKIYRSELWQGVRFPEKMMFEDTIILNVILRRCKRVAVCTDTYYCYRIHGNNTINKLKNSSARLDVVWVIGRCLEICERLRIENTVEYFGYLLLQCSTHLYYRVEGFPEEIQVASFKVACSYVRKYQSRMKVKEVHFIDKVLEKLRVCFEQEDFDLWRRCSKIYPSNHIVISKGIKESRNGLIEK